MPEIYKLVYEKQSKIETIQSECMQNLDKYMTEIIRLNNIIQEKDQMILNLKLENCGLTEQVAKSNTVSYQAAQPVHICTAASDADRLLTDPQSRLITSLPHNDTNCAANSYSSRVKTNIVTSTSKGEPNISGQATDTKPNTDPAPEVSRNNGFTAFRGASNPLSNFYQFKFRPNPCEILNTGKMFSSIEQAYAYGKANFHEDKKRCQLILQAKTARDAQSGK